MQAAYPRFFKAGDRGIGGGLGVARRILPFTVALGALASVGLLFCAPLVPFLLGDEYLAAVDALRWLSPLPLLKAMHLPASDTLSGSGYQGTRCMLLALGAAINIGANIWLIPRYSWRGAAWAAVGTDSFMTGALWSAVVWMSKRDR
jgi:O-antigen/teichoic acid export membrane protein